MRNAHVSDRASRSCGANRLHHRFLPADAFQRRIRADALRHFLDACDAFLAAFADDVSSSELFGEFLRVSRLIAMIRSAPSALQIAPRGSRLLRRRLLPQSTWLYIRRVGGEPAGSENIGNS